MSEHDPNVMAEIARIEQQADEIVEQAKARTAEIRKKSKQDIAELVKSTDEQIKQTGAKLAEEYRSRTEQALTQIDVELVKEQDALRRVREDHMDELVGWTASQIRDQLLTSDSDGD